MISTSVFLAILVFAPGIVRAQDVANTGDTPWKEFGLFLGPIQKHTGVFHNENGVFIPWTALCSSAQSYLLESCDSLINPDGSLTTAGDTAVGCITNGAIITAIAAKMNMSPGVIENLLRGLAPMTGCSGIVDLNQVQASPDIQRLAEFAGEMGNRSPSANSNTNNIPLINTRLNSVVNFCLKSLPKGYAACDRQLSPAVSKICAEHAGQPIDACSDGKVAQYYKIRSTQIAKNSMIPK